MTALARSLSLCLLASLASTAVAQDSDAMLPQRGPMKAWVDMENDPTRPDAVVIQGMPELDSKSAWDSAKRRLRERRMELFQDYATNRVRALAPGWLPGFVQERVLKDWLSRQRPDRGVTVVDQDLLVRDHGFGKSYQGFLLVREPSLEAAGGSLTHRMRVAKEEFLLRCGIVLVIWTVLGLVVFWLDRLTRGYMTKRLALLAVGVGTAAPALLLLI